MEIEYKSYLVTNTFSCLLVDDDDFSRGLLAKVLDNEGIKTVQVKSGKECMDFVETSPPDLILLDVVMPEMDGYEVCRRLKSCDKTKNIPILFITSMDGKIDEAKGLELGARDYISKPINPPIVISRVRNQMNLHFHTVHLEELVDQRTRQLHKGYIETVYRLTLASEYKDEETGAHIKRISFYTKELAQRMGMDKEFCDSIFYASPMHDVGKVAMPDAILLKKGPLDGEEWNIMKTHAEIGAKILEGSDSPLLKMAFDIAGCHHERWDGNGYPRGLNGDQIPLVARIMNICDQYDALRSVRPYKPGFDQKRTISIITEGDGRTMPDHFDPDVLSAFKKMVDVFADIFETHRD
nr:response regulator [Desulfobulbaceae bacterium]